MQQYGKSNSIAQDGEQHITADRWRNHQEEKNKRKNLINVKTFIYIKIREKK
jgi:hypothetical protein